MLGDENFVRCVRKEAGSDWNIEMTISPGFEPRWMHKVAQGNVRRVSSDPEPRLEPNTLRTHASIRHVNPAFISSELSQRRSSNAMRYPMVIKVRAMLDVSLLSLVIGVPVSIKLVIVFQYRLTSSTTSPSGQFRRQWTNRNCRSYVQGRLSAKL